MNDRNNPTKPRTQKPIRVAYYRKSEIDEQDHYAPIHIEEVTALSGRDAEKQVIKDADQVLVRSYKVSKCMRPIGQNRKKHVYAGDPANKSPRRIYERKQPNCKECGAPNKTSSCYCCEEHKRIGKNRRQLAAKNQRYQKAISEGRIPCKNCIKRDVAKLGDYCEHCLNCHGGSNTEHQRKETIDRLRVQIPLVANMLVTGKQHACEKNILPQGKMIPRCKHGAVCRRCAAKWLEVQVPFFVALQRPALSYAMKGEPVPTLKELFETMGAIKNNAHS
jgi:hypothetical protein